MTRIVVTEAAQADLGRLIQTRGLPASTRDRVRASLAPLARFPELGRSLSGRWSGFRVLLGPWPWMLLVYVFDPAPDVVKLVTIQDSRSATSATNRVAEPTLPLLDSSRPDLAARVDEYLEGVGES
jgi:plasmid stabilization system protein ParE